MRQLERSLREAPDESADRPEMIVFDRQVVLGPGLDAPGTDRLRDIRMGIRPRLGLPVS
ncbi:MAG: hypothetical protein HY264_11820 [Chloroflexi bacterium]|nr:hypothetical protein [Chloroflexota bacterium]